MDCESKILSDKAVTESDIDHGDQLLTFWMGGDCGGVYSKLGQWDK